MLRGLAWGLLVLLALVSGVAIALWRAPATIAIPEASTTDSEPAPPAMPAPPDRA